MVAGLSCWSPKPGSTSTSPYRIFGKRSTSPKGELPEDTNEPVVNEINVGLFPVLVVVLSGDAPERTLLRLARSLRDELEGLPGVLEAEIVGDRDEVLDIIIDPLKLESYNIPHGDFVQLASRNNQLIAAGALDTGQGKFSVKVPGLFKSLDDILSLPVKSKKTPSSPSAISRRFGAASRTQQPTPDYLENPRSPSKSRRGWVRTSSTRLRMSVGLPSRKPSNGPEQ